MFKVESLSTNKTSIEDNLPEINSPTQFDISTAEELLLEFDSAKKAGADPNYLKQKQKQVYAKEFSTDPILRAKMDLILDCDPIPHTPIDDLIAQADKGWLENVDLIIHSNVTKFVERGLIEHKDFATMKPDKRYEILKGYAKELEENTEEKLEEKTSPDADL